MRTVRTIKLGHVFLLYTVILSPRKFERYIHSGSSCKGCLCNVSLMIHQGAFDYNDFYLDVPLVTAAYNGDLALVVLLLRSGADPDVWNDLSLTYLATRHIPVINMLLDFCEKTEIMTKIHDNAFVNAVSCDNYSLAVMILNKGHVSKGGKDRARYHDCSERVKGLCYYSGQKGRRGIKGIRGVRVNRFQ